MTGVMAVIGAILWATTGMENGLVGLFVYVLGGGAVGFFLKYFLIGNIFHMFH